MTDEVRIVVLTPPGSVGLLDHVRNRVVKTAPGCVENLHLVVSNINAARSQLVERAWRSARWRPTVGTKAAVDDHEQAEFLRDRPPVSYASFKDPDGNSWVLQQLSY